MSRRRHFLLRAATRVLSYFGIRGGEEKMRENARNWIELANKVWNYRRDLIPAAAGAELRAQTAALVELLQADASGDRLQKGVEALEPLLKKNGGAIYPKGWVGENIEFFLVAGIVIIGIRTYLVQPFKIPTNSMWPTYHGMTSDVFARKSEEPGPLAAAGRLVAFGAWPHRVDAPADGEILVPIDNRGQIYFRSVPGKTWLVLPTTVHEFTLLVGSKPVRIRVPEDFDFNWTVSQRFFPVGPGVYPTDYRRQLQRALETHDYFSGEIDGVPVRCIRTHVQVQAGQRALAFDEMTGDQLFVDRVSYHFVPPAVGSPFVFRTVHIPYIAEAYGPERADQYYVKRLVGEPGDRLEVRGTTLYRNRLPITGADAFDLNARRARQYPGYVADGALAVGQVMTIPEHGFWAMGDNSPNSGDSRFFGVVPDKDVIGRPLWIYFPFSSRWGPAR